MKYAQLEHYLSQPRLNRFLRACGNSKTKTRKLYRINLRVCQAFYPILNLFDFFFRNAIDHAIAREFGSTDWILTEKTGFMNDSKLRRDGYFLKEQVAKAERKLRREGCPVTSTKLIAEQTFGFWTAFFDTKHFSVTRGCALRSFPNKPSTVNRQIIERKLTKIRDVRNRIYHNEPVCFKGNNIDFTDAKEALADIHDLLSWIEPELNLYASSFNNILAIMRQADTL